MCSAGTYEPYVTLLLDEVSGEPLHGLQWCSRVLLVAARAEGADVAMQPVVPQRHAGVFSGHVYPAVKT